MSWLNFNDSLNNLKGQISNLAQSVLAEEGDADPKNGVNEDLREVCLRQEREIENLRRINQELSQKQGDDADRGPQNANWDWVTDDKSSEEQIKILKAENADLLHQLEQLDLDNQQNCAKIINLKDKVQGDYDRLRGEYDALKEEQAKWEEYKSKVIVNDDYKKKYEELLDKCKKSESNNNHHDPQELLQALEDVLRIRELDPGTLQAFDERFKTILKPAEVIEKSTSAEIDNLKRTIEEKNEEIQKLIESSDKLNQEVMQKNRLVREYENEIKEFEKNNELLIMELDSYKSNALETISESNEDKVVSLEEELEVANSRIKDLEAEKYDNTTQTEQKSCDQCTELLNRYDKLQIDHDFLKQDYDSIKEDLKFVNEEYLSLKSIAETEDMNTRNFQQHLDTLNAINEKLQAEIRPLKNKIDYLLKENTNLTTINKETYSQIESLKTELKEKTLSSANEALILKDQLAALTEKLKDVKMTETSLKLQCDTLHKEVSNLNDIKVGLEGALIEAREEKKNFEAENSTKLNELVRELQILQALNEEIKIENDRIKIEAAEFKRLSNENDELTHESSKEVIEELSRENEILRNRVEELEKSTLTLHERNDHLTAVNTKLENELQSNLSLKDAMMSELETLKALKQAADNENMTLKDEILELQGKIETLAQLQQENANLKEELQRVISALQDQRAETINIQESEASSSELQTLSDKTNQLQIAFEQVSKSRDEIYEALKGKHEENVAYHDEIQRLMQIITTQTEKCKSLELQVEKIIDENNFLKEKCDVLTENLLREQEKSLTEKSKRSEEELALKRKLNKLQEHLLESEERHTQELLQAEQLNAELQAKVNKIEEREKSNSTMYTSVNIRANQQVESLQNLLVAVTGERDSLRKQLSDAEDNSNKQTAALTNLQLVLEQFRKDKEKEVSKETERLRRQINAEKESQEKLKKEISALKSQQEETKQGLLAASRLSDQLEQSKRQLMTFKEEALQLKSQLIKKEAELDAFKTQTNGKVDKTLIKNLVIGFVTTNADKLNADQKQILKIISTVLDFSREDHDKLKLNKEPQGPSPQESLSKAFVQFLENESRPKVIPSLLHMNPDSSGSGSGVRPKQNQPGNLTEIVLPTFTDFGQSRNSSSILKDVLKDNS